MASYRIAEETPVDEITYEGLLALKRGDEVIIATYLCGVREYTRINSDADLQALLDGVKLGSVVELRFHASDNGFVDVISGVN